jgi:hypothetical protein
MKHCLNVGLDARDPKTWHYTLAPKIPRQTPCDFSLWRYVKDCVYVPLPADLDELRNRITAAVNSVTEDTLRRIWDEFSYRVDVVCAAGGGHIEHL